MSLERIREEYLDLNLNPNPNCGITVGLVKENSYKDWKVSMIGPKDTSYKGGLFILNVSFPDNYPNEPPEVNFLTPIYHLNINPKASKNEENKFNKLGYISISSLTWWNPKYKIKEILYNIYSLFYFANPNNAYGIERAKEYNDYREWYEEKVKYFTKKYAGTHNDLNKEMKYDRTQDWDFNLEI